MKIKISLVVITSYFLLNTVGTLAQNSVHPRVYTTNAAKNDFIQSIDKVSWKKEFVDAKKQKLEKYLKLWQQNPNWLVSRLQMNWNTKHDKVFLNSGEFAYSSGSAPVPTVRYSGTRDWASDYSRPKLEDVQPYLDDPRGLYLKNNKTKKMEWTHPSKAGFAIEKTNEEIMGLVEDAAFLYWLTGDEKYAKFAAPVFLKYMEGMYYREAPVDLKKSDQARISGLATFEVIHEGIVVPLVTSYDFLYTYLKANNNNLDHSVAVFQKWGDQIIVNGIPDNNWNLFQARFLTYIGIVLDKNDTYKNGKGSEYFLKYTFDESTERQLAVKESLLVYDEETGIWPESPSYSVHVITTLLRIFTLLDHTTNNNEFLNVPIIEKAALASFQYLFPSGYLLGFGDSHHSILPPENFELLISNYKKYTQKEKEVLISSILDKMIADKLYTRKASDYFDLFFYVDELQKNSSGASSSIQLISPTFYAPNVSMFNQRMGKGSDAVMVSTVGSYGNHAHANGIAIELFANNYAIGPDMGKGPSYWNEAHREFYSRFPAHNTVAVDGKSDYSAMRSYHPFSLDNSFPKSGMTSIFDKVTLSKVSFLEPQTNADQQRLTAVIKSKTQKPYIIDIFRSKKQQDGKQKHEYFYHNIGQSLDIFDSNNKLISLNSTDELSTKYGDIKGYDYFEDKKKVKTAQDIQAVFSIKDKQNSFMKLWIKGNENQTIYSVKSPKSNALSKGTAPADLVEAKVPTLVVKRDAAAWEQPFAIVFNPYLEGEKNPITTVEYASLKSNPNVQVIELTLDDKETRDKIIATTSDRDEVEEGDFYQLGLLSITRKTPDAKIMDFLFLSGMSKFIQDGWEIIAAGTPITMSVENEENQFVIQNDGPVVMKVPFYKGKKTAELRIYENDTLIETRQGIPSRSNPEQIDFRLSKAYDKVVIVF
ncbi:heparinase II/III domain-containing protein [Flavobacterium algicola]|uniref:heparinase II/III domain-containing protein n=1 Tax=Flavobacterium algicola TaxID=556529 RepID=UPI001EFE0CE4|nr:heparinase II/III family protein [Flavobacterium algicola]MCG9793096.1 heparinase II/III-family protein [Flavobacterium algicola]